MAYDYKKHFGEITLTQDLTTLPDERTWRLQAPERDAEPHQIVLYLGCNVLRTSRCTTTARASRVFVKERPAADYWKRCRACASSTSGPSRGSADSARSTSRRSSASKRGTD